MNAVGRREEIAREMNQVRQTTLDLLARVPDSLFRTRVHGFYSPVGWHFGHVGRTEDYWTRQQVFGRPPLDPELDFLYTDRPDNPKDARTTVLEKEAVLDFLRRTRTASLEALERAESSESDLARDGYAWEFAALHECQHQETIREMLALLHRERGTTDPIVPASNFPSPRVRWIRTEAGEFTMGSDAPESYDNERPAHPAWTDAFEIADRPAMVADWEEFMDAGGYENESYWSPEGRAWRDSEGAIAPFYWTGSDQFTPDGRVPRRSHEPVWGISAHEAEAYAAWRGARLPSEAEWERAARLAVAQEYRHPHDRSGHAAASLLGAVWQWTSSPFLPYPGFRPFPYEGYSADHMDGRHRVCRGGSFATSPLIARPTFRNWYVPAYRQGFLGVRLARSIRKR